MKAGSVGSIPNGVSKSKNGSQPLRYFLDDVGEAVTNLNTTVVGLDAVEKGHEKPDGLNISWNPINRSAAARKARRFVLEAILVRVSEALSQYIGTISKLPRFKKVTDKWAADSKNKIKISGVRKLTDISKEVIGDECLLLIGACLLVHWRNRAVHRDSNAKLTGLQVNYLIKSSYYIEENFSSLSVTRLLDDFDKEKPTLKDITSLVAMTINFVRKLDSSVSDVSQEDLLILLEHYDLEKKIEHLKLSTTPEKKIDSIVRYLRTTAPGLVEPYCKFYGS